MIFLSNWCHFSIQSVSPFLLPSPPTLTHLFENTGAFYSVLWNENVVLNFHNVERGWAWQVEATFIHSKSHFLKEVVFPVVLAAVTSVWVWWLGGFVGHAEGNMATQWMTTKPWDKRQIFIEQFYSDVGLRKTSLTIRWRCWRQVPVLPGALCKRWEPTRWVFAVTSRSPGGESL